MIKIVKIFFDLDKNARNAPPEVWNDQFRFIDVLKLLTTKNEKNGQNVGSGPIQSGPIQSRRFSPDYSVRDDSVPGHFSPETVQSETIQSWDNSVQDDSVQSDQNCPHSYQPSHDY